MGYNQYSKAKRPYTREELVNSYNNGKTITELSVFYGVGRKIIQRDVERFVEKRRRPIPRNQTGSKNGCWNGGKTKNKKTGYISIRNPKHLNAGPNGYVFEHIVVACEKYGISMVPRGMEIHHIDMDKTNNSKENLFLISGSEHRKLHWQLQRCAIELMKRGLIKFDEKQGYIICG